MLTKRPDEITAADLGRYLNRDCKWSLSTRKTIRSHVSKFFRYLTGQKYVLHNITEATQINTSKLTHKQKEKRAVRPFTEEEFVQLYENTEGWHKWAATLGFDAGLRISDVCSLQWASLSKPGCVIVWTRKRNKRVNLPASKRIMEILVEIPFEDETYVFPDRHKQINDPKRRAAISIEFSRLFRKLGMEGRTFHSLRHGFATKHNELGTDIETIQEQLGHTDSKTTKGYIHD